MSSTPDARRIGKRNGGTKQSLSCLSSPATAQAANIPEAAMTIDDGEVKSHAMLLKELNLSMVMAHARTDPQFLAQLIHRLEERGVDDRTDEENSLLEWARATQRTQGKND